MIKDLKRSTYRLQSLCVEYVCVCFVCYGYVMSRAVPNNWSNASTLYSKSETSNLSLLEYLHRMIEYLI